MNGTEMLHHMIQQLGFDGFGTDEDGRKQLVFDGEIIVAFDDTARRDGLWVVAEIGRVPDTQRENFFRHVLSLNGVGAQKMGPVMAMEKGRILLQEFWSADTISPSTITSALERFLNVAERWKHLLQRVGVHQHRPTPLPWGGVFRP